MSPTERLLVIAHKKCAMVAGEISLTITKRKVSAERITAWRLALQSACDSLEAIKK